ncbi:non-ribosomal peptide synthetase [Streptomyces litchfieldiae]|uniref:Amino acid adenylation domain-containing protein n=1 Tax=Streptomyces litchfieldiae TaxID=3075543 RepID=A0ABU2MR39_9ACTN|nr:non-ribosomal peptide synthetase [Streptomyces sp. DSM 44938]MDT0343936.1 amino acid adenylation domain-containing protein [Streptomyces sp. DSM 44938]
MSSEEQRGGASPRQRELLAMLLARRKGMSAAPRRVPAAEPIAASYAQRRMWFMDELYGAGPTYSVPFVLRFTGDLDTDALVRSIRELYARYEALRTRFERDAEGNLLQHVVDTDGLAVEVSDVGETGDPDGASAESRARRRIDEIIHRPFALTGDPLLRVHLIRVSDTLHLLALCTHHIVSDGWSEKILFAELGRLYTAHVRGVPADLARVPFQYRDYTAWEYRAAAAGQFDDDLAHWVKKLDGAPALLELPCARPRPKRPSGAGAAVEFAIAEELARGVETLREAERASAFAVGLAAFAALLHRYTGADDLIMGVPVANRARTEWEGVFGLFVNTVPLRLRMTGDMTLRELVARTRDELLEAQDHQHIPFDMVANRIAPGRDVSYGPLFQVMGNLHEPHPPLDLPGVRCEILEVPTRTAKLDLTLHLVPSPRGLAGRIEYSTDLFDRPTIDRVIAHYLLLLRRLTDDPGRRLSAFPLLTEEEEVLLAREGETASGSARPGVVLLDAYGHPSPIGTVGELHATGEDGRPAPTGRLALRQADGGIRELGHRDRFVEINGFRVDTAAVATALRTHPAIADCAVLAARTDDLGSCLAACYVPVANGPAVQSVELARHLATALPRHQIPQVFVRLTALPRSGDGDPDPGALAEAVRRAAGEEDPADPEPLTATERELARLWSQLLARPEIRRSDHFFALGGHSLLAVKLIARARRIWQTDLPVRTLFEAPTLAEFACALEERLARQEGQRPVEIARRPADALVPLSPNQESLWFMEEFQPGNSLYHIARARELIGDLNVPALERALAGLAGRHESLRTRIEERDANPVQTVGSEPAVEFGRTDIAGPAGETAERRMEEALRAAAREAARPFDLRRGPLIRAHLYRLAERHHLFVVVVHHIVFDASSYDILAAELAELYRAACADEPADLAELPVQFPDIAFWERGEEQVTAREEAHVSYWTGLLADAPPLLELPTDTPRPARRTYAGESVSALLPADLLARIRSLSAEADATPFMTLLAAFEVLLWRYTGQPDFVVGTTAANREREEYEGQIGYFVNTLPLRATVSGDESFRLHLRRVRETVLEASAHQTLPLAKLVALLSPERSPSYNPLVQIVFDMHEGEERHIHLPGLTDREVSLGVRSLDFDLVLSARTAEDGVRLTVDHNTDLYPRSLVTGLLRHYEVLLRALLADPDMPVARLPLLAPDERAELVRLASGTPCDDLRASTLHQLFEQQVRRTPDSIALTHDGSHLTYARLNADANRLAGHLIASGLGPENRVGLYTERGPHTFIAVLGVLKAGAAYVPLDHGDPPERLGAMLDEAGVIAILAHRDTEKSATRLTERTGRRLFLVDRILADAPERASGTPRARAAGDQLAYVLHTSGSTGRPKAVALPHRSLLNLMRWDRDEIPVRPGEAVLQFNSLGFDASFVEMFAAWQAGGRLVVLSTDATRRDPGAVLDILDRERIGRWDTPYVGLMNVVGWSLAEGGERRLSLRHVMSGGEQLQVTDALQEWLRGVPGCTLINQYGPSEVNRATSQPLPRRTPAGEGGGEPWPTLPPIGRPAYGTSVYVMDDSGALQPMGVPGEVYIGGGNLARCYVNRPDLTAERFVPDPFGPVPGARLYRTGDIARYRQDGSLEFLGRNDSQLKLRGHRVELGEIEAELRRVPGVREAAVAVHGEGVARRLTGYLVPEPGVLAPAATEVRRLLSQRLPDHMLPVHYAVLSALPTTASGKLDRKALPEPADPAPAPGPGAKPRTDRERYLCAVWEEFLGHRDIGIHDSFFDLGGHSLLATRLVARLRQELAVDVWVKDLFDGRTVHRLAAVLDTRARAGTGGRDAEPRVVRRPRQPRRGGEQR